MTPRPDFDFGFGKDRYIRGYGWRGILALMLLLIAIAEAARQGAPALNLLQNILRI